jgi:hypothetical protein
MSDRQIIGQPVPTNAVPIAVKDSDGNLNWPNLDSSGNLKVASAGGGGGAVTIADGADVAEGATTDTKVTGDNTGTVSAKLRGINTILANVWDSLNGWLKVSIQNTTLAVTQSGTWTVQPGNTANTTAWLVKVLGAPSVAYDYTSLSQAATSDTWTFKSGGSGGSTVQTVTINYTDSGKGTISNVAWT